MTWLGLDIGGANLKAATADGWAASVPFALWRSRDQLSETLGELLRGAANWDGVAVTMTGELADCYPDKASGVRDIVAAVERAVAGLEPGCTARIVRYYRTDGGWDTATGVLANPLAVAASNWHALATVAARHLTGERGLLIDIGSTTCDLIPISSAGPSREIRSDLDRMLSGELLYTGVERTPVVAVLPEFTWTSSEADTAVRLAAELFATMGDVYRLLGLLSCDAADCETTADGRPADRPHSLVRLHRLLCADRSEISESRIEQLAHQAVEKQTDLLTTGLIRQQVGRGGGPDEVLLSGHGSFLARAALIRCHFSGRVLDLRQKLPEPAVRCAPAYAVACLADLAEAEARPTTASHVVCREPES